LVLVQKTVSEARDTSKVFFTNGNSNLQILTLCGKANRKILKGFTVLPFLIFSHNPEKLWPNFFWKIQLHVLKNY
jgi:hypothetical protein